RFDVGRRTSSGNRAPGDSPAVVACGRHEQRDRVVDPGHWIMNLPLDPTDGARIFGILDGFSQLIGRELVHPKLQIVERASFGSEHLAQIAPCSHYSMCSMRSDE